MPPGHSFIPGGLRGAGQTAPGSCTAHCAGTGLGLGRISRGSSFALMWMGLLLLKAQVLCPGSQRGCTAGEMGSERHIQATEAQVKAGVGVGDWMKDTERLGLRIVGRRDWVTGGHAA